MGFGWHGIQAICADNSKAGANSNAYPHSNSEAFTDANSDPYTNSEAFTDSNSDPDTDSEAFANSNSNADSNSEAFADSNTILYLPEGPIDFTSKTGRLMGTIRAAIAGLERSEILERVWTAKEEKRRR